MTTPCDEIELFGLTGAGTEDLLIPDDDTLGAASWARPSRR